MMSEGGATDRVASAMRTAFGLRPMQRFDAPSLVGPVPQAGRVVERVEGHGRHLELEWDNGLVLHTQLRRNGAWHLYRRGEPWREPYSSMGVAIEASDWVAVCFNASLVETYRRPDVRRHPGMGRLGPDLCRADTDLGQVVNLILSYDDPEARIADVLLDQRIAMGIGNAYRSEVLWLTGLSPFARVGTLGERDAMRLVNAATGLLRAHLCGDGREGAKTTPSELSVYGRKGQRCHRCGETIEARGCGERQRTLYWCPGCQVRLDPRATAVADDTPVMDPHPAVQKWLADLPWNRDAS